MLHDESVNGQCIGDIYATRCALYYDGRRQREDIFAENQKQGEAQAIEMLEEIKKDCGNAFLDIYPEKKWEVRFFDVFDS